MISKKGVMMKSKMIKVIDIKSKNMRSACVVKPCCHEILT